MGTLTLPPTGAIYVDANVVIYGVERIEPYCFMLEPLWQRTRDGSLKIVTSELTWLEVLAKPLKEKNKRLEHLFKDFLTADEVELVPVTRALWEHAARLRGLGLKTPDAVHAATALLTDCSLFITNDPDLRRVPGLGYAILKELSMP